MLVHQFTKYSKYFNFLFSENCKYKICTIRLRKKVWLKSLKLLPIFASIIVQKSPNEKIQDLNNNYYDLNHRKLIQQSCSNSVNSTSELLTNILMAIIDSSAKYKNCMNYLISSLQPNDEIVAYQPPEESESDIIAARLQAKSFKEEFLELVTMSEHIEKLAVATAEIAFLTGAETLAMIISERLYSVQQKIKEELEAVKNVENELLMVQKSSIENNNQDIYES